MNDRRDNESFERARGLAALAVMTVVAWQSGCSPAVPENPTWTEDVRPILMANCARCHTDSPIGGAPGYIRLDRFENWPNPAGGNYIGAGALADRVVARASDPDLPMPPVIGPLDDRQQAILQGWLDNQAERGAPLPDNAAPTITVGPAQVDAVARTATFDYEILDEEGDYVVGQLASVSPVDDSDVVVAAVMYRGSGQVVWDFTDEPGGVYPVTAIIDDGNTLVSVDVGTVDVPDLPTPVLPDGVLGLHGFQHGANE